MAVSVMPRSFEVREPQAHDVSGRNVGSTEAAYDRPQPERLVERHTVAVTNVRRVDGLEVEVRPQPHVLQGILRSQESFDLSVARAHFSSMIGACISIAM